MLVALFRDNPQAYIAENMKLLKVGSQLKVPPASEAGQTAAEAKQLIQAQSADCAKPPSPTFIAAPWRSTGLR
jgi:FimV-like protein